MTRVQLTQSIPISKIDEDKNLVFGWANVPIPRNPISKGMKPVGIDLVKAHSGSVVAGSLENTISRIENAFMSQFDTSFPNGFIYVEATFEDHIIVRVTTWDPYNTIFFTVPYTCTESDCTFGDAVEVDMVFVEKAMTEIAKADDFDEGSMFKKDREGDTIAMFELEKAVYDYAMNSGLADAEHTRIAGVMVESFFVTDEKLEAMGFSKEAAAEINHGWWLGVKVDDEAFALVKDGTYKAFSIFGDAMGRTTED